jgi:hypothetical protein
MVRSTSTATLTWSPEMDNAYACQNGPSMVRLSMTSMGSAPIRRRLLKTQVSSR